METQPETRAERRRRLREERKALTAPLVDCDTRGHPDQAYAWLMFGIEPEVCPLCGQVPQFGPGASELMEV